MSKSFLTWNIWFNEQERVRRTQRIMEIVHELKPDFIAFQEVVQESLDEIKKFKGEYYLIGTPFYQNYDTIILSKYPCLEWQRYDLPRTNMGRNYLVGEFLWADSELLKVGTFHLESIFNGSGSENIKEAQLHYLESVSTFPTIFMGDTNLKTCPKLFSQDIYDKINKPLAYRYTYAGESNGNIRNKRMNSRLDRIYYKTDQLYQVDQYFLTGEEPSLYHSDLDKYLPPSDHYGVFAKIK